MGHGRLLLLAAIFFILVFVASTAVAKDESSSIVKGFALYQAGRVENIILDSFINDLANERYLKQFFPETSASVNGYSDISGKRLIPLLKHYVNVDLGSLRGLADCVKKGIKQAEENNEKDSDKVIASIDILNWLFMLKTSESFTIKDFMTVNKCNEGSDAEAAEVKAKFEGKVTLLNRDSVEKFLNEAKDKKPFVEMISDYLDEVVEKDAGKGLWAKASFGKLGVSSNENFAKGVDFPGFMKAIKRVSALIDASSEAAKSKPGSSAKKSVGYAVYIHELVVALEALGFHVNDREGFRKFKSSSLFLANLVEAANLDNGAAPEAVAGVIKDFVDEDEVYKNKRNAAALYTRRTDKSNLRCSSLFLCKNTWFVGSYYGFSAGYLDEDSSGKKDWAFRAFGPVGIEFKIFSGPIFGKDTTVTFMAAPIDIGVYITNELKGDKYDVDYSAIASPSYFTSFSSKSSPVSLQVGYQKDVPISNTDKDNMYFVAFSYDLPLFTIW